MACGDGSDFICFSSSFSSFRSGNKKLSPFPSKISSMRSLFWSISEKQGRHTYRAGAQTLTKGRDNWLHWSNYINWCKTQKPSHVLIWNIWTVMWRLLPGNIFCMFTLLCWNNSVSHSRSCNLANCWRQSRKRGKWVPLSSGWASSEMLTSSEIMARAANCAK